MPEKVQVIIEKHLQHQRGLFHNFIDFKKACYRVCHADLWQVLRNFNVEEGLGQAAQALQENSRSAVLLDSQLEKFFKTTPVGDGNLHDSSTSHVTTADPKLSLGAPRRVDDAVVGRGNSGWTTQKSRHRCPCQNCTQGPPAGKIGRGSLLNRPSCPTTTQVRLQEIPSG